MNSSYEANRVAAQTVVAVRLTRMGPCLISFFEDPRFDSSKSNISKHLHPYGIRVAGITSLWYQLRNQDQIDSHEVPASWVMHAGNGAQPGFRCRPAEARNLVAPDLCFSEISGQWCFRRFNSTVHGDVTSEAKSYPRKSTTQRTVHTRYVFVVGLALALLEYSTLDDDDDDDDDFSHQRTSSYLDLRSEMASKSIPRGSVSAAAGCDELLSWKRTGTRIFRNAVEVGFEHRTTGM